MSSWETLTHCKERGSVCAQVPFPLLTCSKMSCLAVTSFSSRSIFFISLLTWSGVGWGGRSSTSEWVCAHVAPFPHSSPGAPVPAPVSVPAAPSLDAAKYPNQQQQQINITTRYTHAHPTPLIKTYCIDSKETVEASGLVAVQIKKAYLEPKYLAKKAPCAMSQSTLTVMNRHVLQ